MAEHGLGPNGALLLALEEVERNVGWLASRIDACAEAAQEEKEEAGAAQPPYFVFDLPGQVELFTCHGSLPRIVAALQKTCQLSVAVVHLTEASHCLDVTKYVSALIVTLTSMMHLACGQVNVLSKVDLLASLGSALALPLSSYVHVDDLRHGLLAPSAALSGTRGRLERRQQRLNEAICELVDDANLVSFIPVAVEDKDCMAYVLGEVDKANGLLFGALTLGNDAIIDVALSAEDRLAALVALVEARYLPPADDRLFI